MTQLRITNKERFQDRVLLPLLSIGMTLIIWYGLCSQADRQLAISLITTFITRLI